MELVEVARELHRLPPEEFTAARTAQARAARAAGDRALATRITELRRPSAAAWEVDRLVREDPERVRALLALGARMAEAQRTLDGAGLRTLGREQHRMLTELRETLVAGAGDGRALSDAVLAQVESTLRAAMADEAAAAAVATGLLVTHLSSTGFEPVRTEGAVAVPEAPSLLGDVAAAPGPAEPGGAETGGAGTERADDVVVLRGARPRGAAGPSRRAGTRAGTDDAGEDAVTLRGARRTTTGTRASRPEPRPTTTPSRARQSPEDDTRRDRERRAADAAQAAEAARAADAAKALADAEATAERAQEALEAATQAALDAEESAAALGREVDVLAERLASAQREHAAARVAHRRAEAARKAAARDATTAAGRVARARDRLDEVAAPDGTAPGPGTT